MNLLFWRRKTETPVRSAGVVLADRVASSIAADRGAAVAALPPPSRAGVQPPRKTAARPAASRAPAPQPPVRRAVPAPVGVDVLADPAAATPQRLSAIDAQFVQHERELQERKMAWAEEQIAAKDEALRQAEERIAAAQQRAAALETRLRESEARSAERLTQIGQIDAGLAETRAALERLSGWEPYQAVLEAGGDVLALDLSPEFTGWKPALMRVCREASVLLKRGMEPEVVRSRVQTAATSAPAAPVVAEPLQAEDEASGGDAQGKVVSIGTKRAVAVA